MSDAFQTVQHVGGQIGFFFGDEEELHTYIDSVNKSKKKALHIQVKARDYLKSLPLSKLSQVGRFNANVSALKQLAELRQLNCEPLEAEQAVLAQYCGWGAVANVFAPKVKAWQKRHDELKGLLTLEQWNNAKASTISAFYTPDWLSAAIWTQLQAAGVKGRLLDSSAGTGALIRNIPQKLFSALKVSLVEKDSVSAEILGHLFPSATVHHSGFEAAELPQQALVVHNPPFGDVPLFDANDSEISGLSLHNYFIAKAAKLLQPNGWQVVLVSSSFMDAKTDKSRAIVAKHATLKAAIRMPKAVFVDAAGANATVDLLVFEQGADQAPTWLDTEEQTNDSGTYRLNKYFIANPENPLGKMTVEAGYNAKNVHCVYNGADYQADVTAAIGRMFAGMKFKAVQASSVTPVATAKPVTFDVAECEGIRKGSYGVSNCGALVMWDGHAWQATDLVGTKKARIAGMCGIREALLKLIQAEQDDLSDNELDALRGSLNLRYDAFVKKYGFIHDSPNARVIKKDPSCLNLLSLEKSYNSGVTAKQAQELGVPAQAPSCDKAEIFTVRAIEPWTAPTTAACIEDAINASFNVYGNLNVDYCASLLGFTDTESFTEHYDGSKIFFDNGRWMPENLFLAGDVKTKLATYQASSDVNASAYVDRLSTVQPADIPFEDVAIPLGGSWIPANVLTRFVESLCVGHTIGRYTRINFRYAANQWHTDLFALPYQVEREFGSSTGDNFSQLLDRLLNGRSLTISYKDNEGKRHVDQQLTLENELNAEKINAAWLDFLAKDRDVQNLLVAIYNEKFNRNVPLTANPDSVVLPSANKNIVLRQNQLNAIYRGLIEGRLLLAHAVGAGKTLTMAAIAHELLRLGIKQRIMIVTPNHLTSQFATEYLRLYPSGEITVLEPEDLSAKERKATLLRIKTGAKLVVVPESSFATIGVPAEVQEQVIAKEIGTLEQALNELDTSEGYYSVKAIERRKAKLEATLKETAADSRKDGLDFLSLGIDCLFLDEAHSIKNLSYVSSRITNVRGGGNPDGSKRAFDFYLKIQCLKSLGHGSLGCYMATATPIANTLIEAYTFTRYMAEELLEEAGIYSLDDWLSTFAVISDEQEIAPTGQGFKLVRRLRSFNNLPELSKMWCMFADSVVRADLQQYLPKFEFEGELFPVIPPANIQNVYVEPTESQVKYSDFLASRAKDFKSSPIDNDNMLLLMSDARKASIDMRLLNKGCPEIEAGNKLSQCADNAAKHYHASTAVKGTQLIFCDLGVPNTDKFSTYDVLKSLLISRGVAASDIAFAHNYRTPAKKDELKAKMNAGLLRVVIASTSLLGTGANVNARMVALHNVDPCYRPCDLEQRIGRADRFGNQLYLANPKAFGNMEIYLYGTRRTLDGFLWQSLETKSNFINSFMKGDKTLERSGASLDADQMNYAQLKAECSGDKRVLEMVNLQRAIRRLEAQRHAYLRDSRIAENNIKTLESAISDKEKLIAGLSQETFEDVSGENFNYRYGNDVSTKYEEAAEVISHLVNGMKSCEIARIGMIGSAAIELFKGNFKDTLTVIGQFGKYPIELGDVTTSIGRVVINKTRTLIAKRESLILRQQEQIADYQRKIASDTLKVQASFDKMPELIECKTRIAELKRIIAAEASAVGAPQAENQVDAIDVDVAA